MHKAVDGAEKLSVTAFISSLLGMDNAHVTPTGSKRGRTKKMLKKMGKLPTDD